MSRPNIKTDSYYAKVNHIKLAKNQSTKKLLFLYGDPGGGGSELPVLPVGSFYLAGDTDIAVDLYLVGDTDTATDVFLFGDT